MAGWSLFSDGSSSDSAETLQNLRTNGIFQDSDETSKFRCLFHLIHSHFRKEISPKLEILPLPVAMGDGHSVDLFKLYWIVKEKGGYDSVTESRSWGATAEEAGLGTDAGAPMKLIYKKHLEHFDRWLRSIVGVKGMQSLWRIAEDKESFARLDADTKCWLRNVLDGKNGHEGMEFHMVKEVMKTPANGHEGKEFHTEKEVMKVPGNGHEGKEFHTVKEVMKTPANGHEGKELHMVKGVMKTPANGHEGKEAPVNGHEGKKFRTEEEVMKTPGNGHEGQEFHTVKVVMKTPSNGHEGKELHMVKEVMKTPANGHEGKEFHTEKQVMKVPGNGHEGKEFHTVKEVMKMPANGHEGKELHMVKGVMKTPANIQEGKEAPVNGHEGKEFRTEKEVMKTPGNGHEGQEFHTVKVVMKTPSNGHEGKELHAVKEIMKTPANGHERQEFHTVKDVMKMPANDHEGKEVMKMPAGGNSSLVVKGSLCDDVIVLESHHANGVSSSLKRSPLKRMREREGEYVFGVLNWVKRIAKTPLDPAIGRALEGSKRNAQEVEYHKQAHIVRKALFRRRNACSSVLRPFFQKRQTMHPSMYEDYVGSRDQSKLRCSQRLLRQHMRSRSSSCSEASTATDDSDKNLSPLVSWMENDSDKQVLKNLNSLTAETVVGLFSKDQIKKRVRVGPRFQARVPEWTGMACNSGDSKWLGTQIWPLKPKELNSLTEEHLIGKGRPDFCNCKLAGSIECIRFHVAEKRFQLKRELGSTFYKWRFDHMGEEVSLSWTDEEERRFKAIVYRNPPSLDKSFWEEAYRSFYYKSRRSLVNYYFDVFLLRRRSYQNRVTPNQIDSDDEESEFGSVSSGFGHDAVVVNGLKSIMCSQNKQCMDLDESLDLGE
ncbi:hypothetical protein AAC387_Pa12g0389 [Persea americana]